MVSRASSVSQSTSLRSAQSGFALVMALALMAFLVLLVLSLATISRVESEVSRAQRDHAAAQANALLALDLALGQLQDAAGPDRRATARADLVGGSEGTRPWIGVWKASGDPVWLVSGRNLDPKDPLGSDDIASIPGMESHGVWFREDDEDPNEAPVYAPLVRLTTEGFTGGENQRLMGRYGYWVDDESLKASVVGADLTDAVDEAYWGSVISSGFLQPPTTVLRQRSNQGVAFERVGRTIPVDADNGEVEDLMLYPWLLQNASPAVLRAFDAELGKSDDWASYGNFGLLTNPLDGGLKLNLSSIERGYGRFDDVLGSGLAMDVWRSYPPPETMETEMHGVILGVRAELNPAEGGLNVGYGEPYRHVAPLLTEAALYVSVYERQNVPSIRYIFDLELWNPYPFALFFPNGGDNRPLTISAINLPDLEVSSVGGSTGRRPMDEMPRSNAGGPQETTSWIQLTDRPGTNNTSGTGALLPGEIYRSKEPDPGPQPQGLWKIFGGSSIGTIPAQGYRVDLEGKWPEGAGAANGVDFRLNSGSELDREQIFFEVRNIPFDEFRYTFNSSSFPPYKGIDFGVEVADMYVFAHHFRLGRRWEDHDVSTSLIEAVDLREPILDYLQTPGVFEVASSDPIQVNSSLTGIFNGTDLFWDDEERTSSVDEYGDFRMFDYPLGFPSSVADFRLLPYRGLPPRALGSAGLDVEHADTELNQSFDRYFVTGIDPDLSGIPQNSGVGVVFPNTRLSLLPAVGNALNEDFFATLGFAEDDSAARFFFVRGAFNLNATSEEAWMAVLAADFDESVPWEFDDGTGFGGQWPEFPGEASATSPPIFRFGQTAGYSVDPKSDFDLRDLGLMSDSFRRQMTRQGVRFPESDWLENFVTALIGEIKAQGRPFESLYSLIESGVIERALESTNTNPQESGGGFSPAAPTYLTQSDIVARLSNFATIRGDTFTIQTYGDVVNAVTGRVEGRAKLEARVQREYSFVDESLDVRSDADEPRRFRILELRWITP